VLLVEGEKKPTRIMRFLLWVSVLAFTHTSAQQKNHFTKVFQLSLAPGISTNGLHPGGYANYFSLNLTSGYSSANHLFEAGLISNLNENRTRGLQFAGIANVTGGNSFAGMQLKEIDKTIREGFEANLSGAQFSGVANIVLNNVFGWQTTGGVNVVRGALMGLQLAGISNTVLKYSFGVQLAGLYNVSAESMDGVQVAGLFNITEGGLYGVQVGMINKTGFTRGINSFANNDPTGIQIGLVNFAQKMDGFQIGLINFGKRTQGTQLGLINIYNNGREPQTRDGTSIGLLNIGSAFSMAVFTSDIFVMNFEIGTGTSKNVRMTSDRTAKYIMNGLIYSRTPSSLNKNEPWALGYGLKKYFFNKSMTPGMMRFRFISFGADWLHVNHERKKITQELSLVFRPVITAGSRLHPKNKNFFFFFSAAYNVYRSESGKKIDRVIEGGGSKWQHWPGFSAGVSIH
jgi:hypothetical protein